MSDNDRAAKAWGRVMVDQGMGDELVEILAISILAEEDVDEAIELFTEAWIDMGNDPDDCLVLDRVNELRGQK